jgi:hypothetical protein
MCKIMKMLYRTIRHQQSVLIIKVTSAPRRTLKGVFDKNHIVRMSSLQYQIGRRFGPRRVPVNPSRLLGPEYPLRTSFHSDKAGVTESLRVCQLHFAPPKFDFGPLPRGDIHYRADNLDAAGFTRLGFSNDV